MKAQHVGWKLTVPILPLLLSVAWAVDPAPAPIPNSAPTPPSGTAAPIPPAPMHRPHQLEPMPQTINGKPIDSSMSVETFLKYLDEQVQSRIRPETKTPFMRMPPQLAQFMSPTLVKFGSKTLLAAYKEQASPHVEKGDLPATTLRLKQYENWIISQALELAATDSDLPKLLIMARKDPVIFSLILQKRQWLNNPSVSEMMLDRLKAVKDPAADPTTPAVLNYALNNPNPAFQKALTDVLQKWIDRSASKPQNIDLELDNLIIDSIALNNTLSQTLFPTWATTRAAGTKDMTTPQAQLRYTYLITGVAQSFRGRPEAFAQAPLRQGVATLLPPVKGAPTVDVYYDFLAAGTGDAGALKDLLQAYSEFKQHPNQGPLPTPGAPPPAANPSAIQLNGHPVSNPYEIPSYGESLLNHVTFQGSGDKLTGVLAHIDSATYANGQWTVTDPQFKNQPAADSASASSTVGSSPPSK